MLGPAAAGFQGRRDGTEGRQHGVSLEEADGQKAFRKWVKLHPLKHEISGKLSGDHLLAAPSLSKKASIDAAVERHVKNQKITKSSWLLLDHSTPKNKAKQPDCTAPVFRNKKEISTRIKRRTVTISRVTPKEPQRYKHEEVTLRGEKRYLNYSSEKSDPPITVVGDRHPLTGNMELYQDERVEFKSTHKLLPSYPEWVYDDWMAKAIQPSAKK